MNMKKLINMSVAIMASLSLAVYPAYAQEVTIGDHDINLADIETVCANPEDLGPAISEVYTELLTENPDAAELFAGEVNELAETVADIPLEEATVEVVETVAEVAPQLVQSVTQTQEGTGTAVNVELAGLVQNFLETAPQVLADQPEMINMLNAADQQLEFGLANAAFQEAGVENMGEFMKNIMEQSGGDPEAMQQAAKDFFAQHGEEFSSIFGDDGIPNFIDAQCNLFGEAFDLIEANGGNLFLADGEINMAVVGAAYDGEIPDAVLGMLEHMSDGMPEGGEFNFADFTPEMFMDHAFERGEFQGFAPEGEFFGPDGELHDMGTFDPVMMEMMGFDMEQMSQEHYTEVYEQIQNEIADYTANHEDAVQQQNPYYDQGGGGGCVEHNAAPPHDKFSDGHGNC